jgi:hypothetical protein
MKAVISTLLLAGLLLLSSNAFTQDEAEEPVKPDDDKENPLENVDINIIKRDDHVIEAHSINGKVFMVKVTPTQGVPYYLYDTDGDGSLETRSSRALRETTVNQWKIYEW